MPLPAYLQHFTDRQYQIAAFDALWPGDGRWILAFSGVSGNGKSTLANWLIEERCKSNGWRWEKVDFAINQPVEAVPRALAALAGGKALTRFGQDAVRACEQFDSEQFDSAIAEINLARAGRTSASTITQTTSSGGQISGSPPRIDAQWPGVKHDA